MTDNMTDLYANTDSGLAAFAAGFLYGQQHRHGAAVMFHVAQTRWQAIRNRGHQI
jgi:hypothetical protein